MRRGRATCVLFRWAYGVSCRARAERVALRIAAIRPSTWVPRSPAKGGLGRRFSGLNGGGIVAAAKTPASASDVLTTGTLPLSPDGSSARGCRNAFGAALRPRDGGHEGRDVLRLLARDELGGHLAVAARAAGL